MGTVTRFLNRHNSLRNTTHPRLPRPFPFRARTIALARLGGGRVGNWYRRRHYPIRHPERVSKPRTPIPVFEVDEGRLIDAWRLLVYARGRVPSGREYTPALLFGTGGISSRELGDSDSASWLERVLWPVNVSSIS